LVYDFAAPIFPSSLLAITADFLATMSVLAANFFTFLGVGDLGLPLTFLFGDNDAMSLLGAVLTRLEQERVWRVERVDLHTDFIANGQVVTDE